MCEGASQTTNSIDLSLSLSLSLPPPSLESAGGRRTESEEREGAPTHFSLDSNGTPPRAGCERDWNANSPPPRPRNVVAATVEEDDPGKKEGRKREERRGEKGEVGSSS